MTVHVSGKGDVAMRDLNAGDQVLTIGKEGALSYETIYTINHYQRIRLTEFLQLRVNEGEQHPLELSKMHMVFVKGQDHPKPAHEIAVGDFVQILPLSNRQRNTTATGFDTEPMMPMQKGVATEYAQVVQIQTVVRHGFYNPLTTTGRIVVNGVVASAYASLSAVLHSQSLVTVPSAEPTTMLSAITSKGGIIRLGNWNIISEQLFLDIMLSPHRMVSLWKLRLEAVAKYLRKYKLISKRDDATEENKSDEFLSAYCSIGIMFMRWWEQQHHWLQVIAFFLVLFVFGGICLLCNAMAFVSQQTLVLCALIGCKVFARWRGPVAGGQIDGAPRKGIK